ARSPYLPRPPKRSRLGESKGVASFYGGFRGKLLRRARIRTPFILERAKPPQDGGAKAWAVSDLGRLSAGPRRAGQAKSPSVPEHPSQRKQRVDAHQGSGDRPVRLRRGLPRFFHFLPFISAFR